MTTEASRDIGSAGAGVRFRVGPRPAQTRETSPSGWQARRLRRLTLRVPAAFTPRTENGEDSVGGLMTKPTLTGELEERVASLPWPELHSALDAHGFAQTPAVLSARECGRLARLYESGNFRSRIVMARHRFGEGEYQY